MARLPVVGVMGSGEEAFPERSLPLGRALAAQGVHLLTGGGGGVMAAVSRAFQQVPARRGLVLAVLPGDPATGEPPTGYPHPFVEVAIRTHLPARGPQGSEPDSRNHLNVLSCDVVVALPGREGTASEVALALRYGRPLAAWASAEELAAPAAVPRLASLDEVTAFVAAALRRR